MTTKNGPLCKDGVDERNPDGSIHTFECGCRLGDDCDLYDEDCMYLNEIQLDDNGQLEVPFRSIGYNKPIPAFHGSNYVEIVSYDAVFGHFVVNRLTKNYPVNPRDLRLADVH